MDANYIGNELELFAHAKHWKRYWGSKIVPYIGDSVLEVGAGIGTNTKCLLTHDSQVEEWMCIEPDEKLANQIIYNTNPNTKAKIKVKKGYLKDYKTDKKFDTILYIDVIEHIESDREEIELAKSFLNDDGYLIILVPAHNYFYSNFDKAIGHYRRYNKKMLKAVVGQDLQQEKLLYMDSIGMAASFVNKLFLKQRYPTIKQIRFWDNYIIPTSQICDSIFMYSLGKTLLGIWKKQ